MWWGVVVPARPPGNSMVFLLVSFVRHRNPWVVAPWEVTLTDLFRYLYELGYSDFGRFSQMPKLNSKTHYKKRFWPILYSV
jgi:hypothetical protein